MLLKFATSSLNFHMFGDGPMRDELELSSVSFHVCEQHEIWQKLDVLVVCSRAEGLPMVVLEAMHGVLVIVSPVGQLPHIVSHLTNGLLMADNSAQALSKQLNNLINLTPDQITYMLTNAYFGQATVWWRATIQAT